MQRQKGFSAYYLYATNLKFMWKIGDDGRKTLKIKLYCDITMRKTEVTCKTVWSESENS